MYNIYDPVYNINVPVYYNIHDPVPNNHNPISHPLYTIWIVWGSQKAKKPKPNHMKYLKSFFYCYFNLPAKCQTYNTFLILY